MPRAKSASRTSDSNIPVSSLRLRYFPFDRLKELASLQADEQEQRDIAELLAGLNGEP